ncbi:MAG: 23S rRNA (adenine(2503)-C(2))-methyltransferase RlmN [Candidatus Hydrogenedentota bacterium]
MSAAERTYLSELFPEEIATALSLKPFQGRQVFQWIHQKKVFDVDEMTNLSKVLRAELKENYGVNRLEPYRFSESAETETKKALLKLADGETVETVFIPAKDRLTLCVSSQVGCAVKCTFCATGLSGYARNLTTGEIVEQALYFLAGGEIDESRNPNIVYMGMGEPFHNYDAVVKSIRLLMHEEGLNLGARRITVSTAGEVKGIERFAKEDWQVRLSVSLHAANDELRNELVPLNRKYNLERLMDAIDVYVAETGRQMTFEWTLLEGVNDSLDTADELIRLVGDMKSHVNLIPYNPVEGLSYAPPHPSVCRAFKNRLEKHGVTATLRLERGQDIDAACGQLRRHTLSA